MLVISHNEYSIMLKVEIKMSQNEKLKTAQKGAFLSLTVYVILSIIKFIVGYLYNSTAIKADSLTNMNHIIVSLAVIICFKISTTLAYNNHPFDDLNSENISSLLVSFIIIFVRIQFIIENAPELLTDENETP